MAKPDYLYNPATLEVASADTSCSAGYCKEYGCGFPDCAKSVDKYATEKAFWLRVDDLKADGKTTVENLF